MLPHKRRWCVKVGDDVLLWYIVFSCFISAEMHWGLSILLCTWHPGSKNSDLYAKGLECHAMRTFNVRCNTQKCLNEKYILLFFTFYERNVPKTV